MTILELRVQQCLPRMYQTLQTTKMNFENLLGQQVLNTTIAIRFNPPQVYPSVPTFVFAVLFSSSFLKF